MKTFIKAGLVFGLFIGFWFVNTVVTDGAGVFGWILEEFVENVKIPKFISERSFIMILDRALFFTAIVFIFSVLDESGLKPIKKILRVIVSFPLFVLVFFVLSLNIFDKVDALYPF